MFEASYQLACYSYNLYAALAWKLSSFWDMNRVAFKLSGKRVVLPTSAGVELHVVGVLIYDSRVAAQGCLLCAWSLLLHHHMQAMCCNASNISRCKGLAARSDCTHGALVIEFHPQSVTSLTQYRRPQSFSTNETVNRTMTNGHKNNIVLLKKYSQR